MRSIDELINALHKFSSLEDEIDALEMYEANIGGYIDSVVLKDIV